MTLARPWVPWAFLGPFLGTFAVFTLLPLGESAFLATRQTFGPEVTVGVGADNFRFLLADPMFWRALGNTGAFTAASVVIQVPLALLLALALNRPGVAGRTVLRLVFFSPQLVGTVFAATVFAAIFDKRTGLLNEALHGIHPGWDPDFPWLEEHALVVLVVATLWTWTGFHMVLLLAALQAVDSELLDAAALDGAGPWQRLRWVILPSIRPVLGFCVLTAVIGSAQFFELAWVMLGGPGHEGQGLFIVTYLYQRGFETGDLGYASAIGWVLAALLVGFTLAWRRIERGAEA